jgi:hypothetical protein
VPNCRCERTDSVILCPQRYEPGGVCAGDSDAKGKQLNTPGTGQYTCFTCGTTLTYAGPSGAPCAGFNNSDGKHYNGVTDCTP